MYLPPLPTETLPGKSTIPLESSQFHNISDSGHFLFSQTLVHFPTPVGSAGAWGISVCTYCSYMYITAARAQTMYIVPVRNMQDIPTRNAIYHIIGHSTVIGNPTFLQHALGPW